MLHPRRPTSGPPLSRRALLTRVIPAGMVALASGCNTGMAAGAADPGAASGGTLGPPALLSYADLAGRLSTAAFDFRMLVGAPPSTAAWASAAAAMCHAQAAVLGRSDPLTGTPVPPDAGSTPSGSTAGTVPTATPSAATAGALTRVAADQAGIESAMRDRCLAAPSGDLALLFASLGVAAHAVSHPSVPVVATGTVPFHCHVGDRSAALVVLLSRVDALVEGLDQGLGALPFHDPAYTPGLTRLSEVETLRDTIQQDLLAASVTPTPGPLDYALPGTTDSPAHVQTLWGMLERDVMAAWLRVAAASIGADRGAAFDAAVSQQDLVAGHGVGISWWPGWV